MPIADIQKKKKKKGTK